MACINDNTFSSNFHIDSNNDNFNPDINITNEHNEMSINDLSDTIDVTDGDSHHLIITDIKS